MVWAIADTKKSNNSVFVTILAQSSYKVWKICYHILGLQCIRYISTFSAKIISHKNLYYCANIKRIYRRELVVVVKTILINMTLASIQYADLDLHICKWILYVMPFRYVSIIMELSLHSLCLYNDLAYTKSVVPFIQQVVRSQHFCTTIFSI